MAFVSATTASSALAFKTSTTASTRFGSKAAVARKAMKVRMMAQDDEVEKDTPLEKGGMRDMVMQDLKDAQTVASEARSEGKSVDRRRLGATVDADGKGNIWAVEPMVSYDDSAKAGKYGVIAGFAAAVFVLVAVLLPKIGAFTNADQF
eukprot:CAMPEP_0184693500 /NCGR_PEP_ID=MMETSP0313-20130426/1695_1 /TAXON_ID=2792 /ORGANISM="Porphyridium aerugineum, Strain SAG 1380-2" /LENGTH=148 /DNA_ID=CAMNT_0027151583 /DNA_START=108 /DNA_END=554 /DNA_ORIENTATION=-